MLRAAADCNISLNANPYVAHQNLNSFVNQNGVAVFEFYMINPENMCQFAKAITGLKRTDRHLEYLL